MNQNKIINVTYYSIINNINNSINKINYSMLDYFYKNNIIFDEEFSGINDHIYAYNTSFCIETFLNIKYYTYNNILFIKIELLFIFSEIFLENDKIKNIINKIKNVFMKHKTCNVLHITMDNTNCFLLLVYIIKLIIKHFPIIFFDIYGKYKINKNMLKKLSLVNNIINYRDMKIIDCYEIKIIEKNEKYSISINGQYDIKNKKYIYNKLLYTFIMLLSCYVIM